MVVTNGSLTGRFKELMQFPESLKKRLIFKMSFLAKHVGKFSERLLLANVLKFCVPSSPI